MEQDKIKPPVSENGRWVIVSILTDNIEKRHYAFLNEAEKRALLDLIEDFILNRGESDR